MKRAKPITAEQQSLLLNELGNPMTSKYGLMWVLAAHTGFRISDILKLRYCDIGDKGRVSITETKTKKERVVYVRKAICEAIENQRAIRQASEDWPIVYNERKPWAGISRTQAYNIISRAGRVCGVNATPHSGRKSYAVKLYADCHNLFTVQAALNHASVGTTAMYVFADELNEPS